MAFLFTGYYVSGQEVQLNSATVATGGIGSERSDVNISKWSLGEVHLFVLNEQNILLAAEEASGISADIKAYPNPFRSMLNLQFVKEFPGGFTIHITDLTGKVQWLSPNLKAEAGQVIQADLSKLDPAIYLVYIISKENETIHVFKVHKF